MLDIKSIRDSDQTILAFGSYRPGYQAILDFDSLCGRESPSVVGIVGPSKRFEKYFWGDSEVLIPCFKTIAEAKKAIASVDWLFNLASARRATQTTVDFFELYPEARGAHLFAEEIPEQDALALYQRYSSEGKNIVGPAGVGLVVPGSLKLGVIGGVDWRQIQKNHLHQPGSVAILSASGGMVNEIISLVASSHHAISFALCVGGDRFPATTPTEGFLSAEKDLATTHIVYYGELGGYDEYELADLIRESKVTKPVIAYIAGVIDESFDQPVQFGHAKALASNKSESASSKRSALKEVGVQVAESMTTFSELIADIPPADILDNQRSIKVRSPSLFSSTISSETADGYAFVGSLLQDWASESDIATQITTALLGRRPKSPLTSELVRMIFLLSVDHGPQVSGAINTIVTARAGNGLVDSLASGLLTIGPRFGGAITDAAREWQDGVSNQRQPAEHVESYAKAKKYISGIGHKKYRLDLPDPRTKMLAEFAGSLDSHLHFDYAKAIEAITSAKKGNLILNVDGHIAALMLDVLSAEEVMTPLELQQLIETDFFNALFVIPRTVGFIAHYLDQKRLDEGLFRLPDSDIFLSENP